MTITDKLHAHPLNRAVIVAGLGFFVDAFDLLLFNVLRIPSLKELGLSGDELTRSGEYLLSMQMLGMIVGGILSGIIGDRKGRVSVLFGSILLYSLANLANAWVKDVPTYAWIRFLSGVGLAGELGAGITLVSESMTVERRGYGTILVASLGACGAIAAGLAGDLLYWRTTYIIAGSAGLLLLLLRLTSLESGMFKQAQQKKVSRGSFRLLFSDRKRTLRYFAFVLVGVPIWYCVGMVINLSPELARTFGIDGVRPATCFILFQMGIAIGDLTSGIISQKIKSRKRVLVGFMALALAAVVLFFMTLHAGFGFNALVSSSLLMGFGCGYMSIFVTTAAEAFGTNLRVTVTATITNFMRGAITLLIPLRIWLENIFSLSLFQSLIVVGSVVFLLALYAASTFHETYGKRLDYVEE
jgi:MFS family permease